MSHVDPKFGGIAKVVPELCGSISSTGECQSSIVALCDREERAALGNPPCRVEFVPGSRWQLKPNSFYADRLRAAGGVHIHGIWEPHCRTWARAARAVNKPYVLSAHGMLEPWALNNKRLKKAIYSAIVERANVRGAACLHALTDAEAANYRHYGAKNPIAVIPNGVRVPSGVTSTQFFERFPALAGKRCVLFLGRIHYKKGLDLLVRVWREVARADGDAHLVLAGPDSDNTQAAVEAEVARYRLENRVTFTGMLRGADKWSAIQACELFVLPSYSEGFSVSVLEAIGLGKPAVVTRQCNIPEIQRHGCGWVIEPEEEQLSACILEFLRMPASRVSTIARNGESLVERHYNWATIGEQMRALYEWLLSGRAPYCVDLRV